MNISSDVLDGIDKIIDGHHVLLAVSAQCD
jgi:hypothetical protein